MNGQVEDVNDLMNHQKADTMLITSGIHFSTHAQKNNMLYFWGPVMKTELPGYTLRYRVVGFRFPTVYANLDHMTLIRTALLAVPGPRGGGGG